MQAGQEAAEHDSGGAASESFGNIATVADTAVGDEGDTARLGGFGAVGNGGELRHACAGDDAGGAYGACADAHLDYVGASFGQHLHTLGGHDIAGEDWQFRVARPHGLHGFDDAVGMAVGGVDSNRVHTGVDKAFGASQPLCADADGAGHDHVHVPAAHRRRREPAQPGNGLDNPQVPHHQAVDNSAHLPGQRAGGQPRRQVVAPDHVSRSRPPAAGGRSSGPNRPSAAVVSTMSRGNARSSAQSSATRALRSRPGSLPR